MSRPQTVTDDAILQAARHVMLRRGPDGFTLSEVASAVGLSRAAIILRFESAHALKVRLLTQMVDRFCRLMDERPKTPSGDHLLELAAFIGGMMRAPQNLASFFAIYGSHMKDAELAALEIKRGEALRAAISRVMPETSIAHASAVLAFKAHLSGSIMAWPASEASSPRAYLIERTREWLRLARISYSESFLEALHASAAPVAEAPVSGPKTSLAEVTS